MQREVIDNLKCRRIYTPDLKDELEPYSKHIVMIWDSFKIGFPSEKQLENCSFLGDCWTIENNFLMKVCPTFPIIWQTKNVGDKESPNQTRVYGEAYAMDIHQLMRLDAVMDNHSSYIRRKRYIALEDQMWPKTKSGPERHVTVEAWIYLSTQKFKEEVAKHMGWGSQVKIRDRYYWQWRHENMKPLN